MQQRATPSPCRRANRRAWLALVLLGVAVALLAALGYWQLDRADQRRLIAQSIDAGRRLPPLALAAATPVQALQPWRAAHARGYWRNDLTVLLDNRNHRGRPGFWVATPLEQPDGSAVLVLRGWLAREFDVAPAIPPGAAGLQVVTGELTSHIPRLFELPSLRTNPANTTRLPPDWPASVVTNTIPRVQNLSLDSLARATGLDFIPTVLLQTAPVDQYDDMLIRDWPQPSIDANQNIGYAVQWFAFAVIAGAAWLLVLRRLVRPLRCRLGRRGT